MARTSGLPFLHCRFCGTRFRKAEVSKHELECLEKSEEQLTENTKPQRDQNVGKRETNVKHTHLKGKKTSTSSGDKTNRKVNSPSQSTTKEDPVTHHKKTPKKQPFSNKNGLKDRKAGVGRKRQQRSTTNDKERLSESSNSASEKPSTSTSEEQPVPQHNQGPKKDRKAGVGKIQQRSTTNDKGRHSESSNSASEKPSTSTSEEQPLPQQGPKKDPSKEKEALKEIAYPKVSAEMIRKADSTNKEPLTSNDSLPDNALVKNDPKQAWNANAPRKMSGKLSDPFPPARKYRHYPVSCEFCNRKFQPGPLRKHIQKYHPDEHLPPNQRGRDMGRIRPPDRREEKAKKKRPPSGPPRQMKICYICGRMFGTKSIHIHEPKCLEKWKIENEKLPKSKRMPEPVKPEAIPGPSEGSSVSGSKQNPQRNLPELDAEAEAAYRCHLKNLVPCSHCGRTFNPDRVMVHENACVERPRERKRRKRK